MWTMQVVCYQSLVGLVAASTRLCGQSGTHGTTGHGGWRHQSLQRSDIFMHNCTEHATNCITDVGGARRRKNLSSEAAEPGLPEPRGLRKGGPEGIMIKKGNIQWTRLIGRLMTTEFIPSGCVLHKRELASGARPRPFPGFSLSRQNSPSRSWTQSYLSTSSDANPYT